MKALFNKFFLLSIMSMLIWSCKKDEVRVIAADGKAAVLTASSSNLVLTKANAANTAITFTITAPDYGYDAAVTSTLQLGVKGTNFANAKEFDMDANALTKSFTVIDFNALLLSMNLAPEATADIEARIKSSISANIAPVFSNAAAIKVTPYALISFLYVPGAYQGWTPSSAESLISATSNGIYEGVINFTPGNTEFKILTKRDWGTPEYGTGASAGTISVGGGNLAAPGTGNYKLVANLNDNTLEFIPFSWGLIGNAPVGSDWGGGKDIVMKYDNSKMLWTVTAEMMVGEFKFRLNNDWSNNFGDNGDNGSLEGGGDNIKITSAGTYTFELNLVNNTYKKTKI
ncbi:SusE domain-containing protein [Daejeonella oryzae]|uniref:SusE domain-containing protein n=1 Tax=Daejeonella oryzae TaxID=1122943 RepID=UPI00047A7C41|nr:SusE domain-containing protein [Daejeonella oryzae]